MKYDSDAHHRRSTRLPDYDYTQNGVYFVTVCAHGRECLFGDVGEDGVVRLNDYGAVVQEEWLRTEIVRAEVELGVFVVMPNHFHGIVVIHDVGAHGRAPLQNPSPTDVKTLQRQPRSLGSLVAGFKSIVTKRINTLRDTPGAVVWQRNYYEHIIRDERDLNQASDYILCNPARWAEDRENPAYTKA